MTFGSFLLGSFLFALGFVSVWKTNWFLNNFGDIGTMLGVYDKPWLSWKTFGLLFMLVGFLIAFELFQLFFNTTIGRLFFLWGKPLAVAKLPKTRFNALTRHIVRVLR